MQMSLAGSALQVTASRVKLFCVTASNSAAICSNGAEKRICLPRLKATVYGWTWRPVARVTTRFFPLRHFHLASPARQPLPDVPDFVHHPIIQNP
jgi:hypothetical protein